MSALFETAIALDLSDLDLVCSPKGIERTKATNLEFAHAWEQRSPLLPGKPVSPRPQKARFEPPLQPYERSKQRFAQR